MVRKFPKPVFQNQVSYFLPHNAADPEKRSSGPWIHIHYIWKIGEYNIHTYISETVQAFHCGNCGFIDFFSSPSLVRSKASVILYFGNSCFPLFSGFSFFLAKFYELTIYSKRKRFFSCNKAYAQMLSLNILTRKKSLFVLELCDQVCCLCSAAESWFCDISFAFFRLFCNFRSFNPGFLQDFRTEQLIRTAGCRPGRASQIYSILLKNLIQLGKH